VHITGIRTNAVRLISGALLLVIFFLPFHLHFSVQTQITKECSCVHGTRAQLAPAVIIVSSPTLTQTHVPIAPETVGRFTDRSNLGDARAPPSALSA